jgi:hypothetical protein
VIVSAKKIAERLSTIGKVRERMGYARDNWARAKTQSQHTADTP